MKGKDKGGIPPWVIMVVALLGCLSGVWGMGEELGEEGGYRWTERCASFTAATQTERLCYRVFHNVSRGGRGEECSPPEKPCNVELVTQMTLDRFNQLEKLVILWEGYISVVVFGSSLQKPVQAIDNFLERCGCECWGLTIHIVVGSLAHHPINLLRNVAFEHSHSHVNPKIEYVSIYDVDFIPNPGLCGSVIRWTDQIERTSKFSKTLLEPIENSEEFFEFPQKFPHLRSMQAWPDFSAMVMPPAFEMKQKSGFPKTKEGMAQLLETQRVTRFHSHFEGQEADLTLWKQAKTPFAHHPIKLLNEHYAFFSVKDYYHRNPPGYHLCPEEFFDRGFNKIMCYLHLRLLGFKPYFLPDAWLIHDYGIHHSLSLPSDGPINDDLQVKFSGLYRESVLRHLLFQGVCDLLAGLGWLEIIHPLCDDICSMSVLEKLILSPRKGKIKLRKCYNKVLKLQGLRVEDPVRQLAAEYKVPYEDAIEIGAQFADGDGEIPYDKIRSFKKAANNNTNNENNNNRGNSPFKPPKKNLLKATSINRMLKKKKIGQ